jgi:hypothetical protein
VGTGSYFPDGKAAGGWNHSPPSSAVVKNAWSYTSTSPYVFMVWYLVKHRLRLHGLVHIYTRVYPKISGLAAWSENCK